LKNNATEVKATYPKSVQVDLMDRNGPHPIPNDIEMTSLKGIERWHLVRNFSLFSKGFDASSIINLSAIT